MNVEHVLSRLDGVRDVKQGCYVAKCPAHQDRKPSLTIKDAGDRILLHCFAGCEALDVIAAMGLDWSDLFEGERPKPSKRTRWPAHALLAALEQDLMWMAIANHHLARGEPITGDDRKRFDRIHARILEAKALCEA